MARNELDKAALSADWSEPAQEEFWRVLVASRKRPERIGALINKKAFEVGRADPEAGLAVLHKARELGRLGDPHQDREALVKESMFHKRSGRPTEAMACLERACEMTRRSDPNWYRVESMRLDALVDLGRIDEALGELRALSARKRLKDPRDWFALKAVAVRCAKDTGDFDVADRISRRIYKAFPVPSIDDLSTHQCLDMDGMPLEDPAVAADAVVAEFTPPEGGLDGIRHVERAIRGLRTEVDEQGRFVIHVFDVGDVLRESCHRQTIPAVGAYVGQVLVEDLGGSWIKETPLMRHRVRIRGLTIDPFELAWWMVYYHHGLAAQLLQILGSHEG